MSSTSDWAGLHGPCHSVVCSTNCRVVEKGSSSDKATCRGMSISAYGPTNLVAIYITIHDRDSVARLRLLTSAVVLSSCHWQRPGSHVTPGPLINLKLKNRSSETSPIELPASAQAASGPVHHHDDIRSTVDHQVPCSMLCMRYANYAHASSKLYVKLM